MNTREKSASTKASLKQPKRYLIVINEIGFIYSHFWKLALEIKNDGWDVVIASTANAGPQRAIEAGMKFVPIRPTFGIGHPIDEFNSILELRRTIHLIKPDVLHLVSLKNVLLGSILARFAKTPAVLGAITGLGTMFVENHLLYRILRPLVIAGLRFGFAHENAVMALENPDDEAFFIEKKVVNRDRTIVIPGAGMDQNAIVPLNRVEGVPVILCVSRMIKNKGILQLVEAAKLLNAQGLKFELHLVGDIDPRNPTSLTGEELQSLQHHAFVKWLGRRSDVANLLNSANVFCLPSYYREGLPRSLVEACAAGLPIVTTDVAGCRQVVVDGETGYLVPPQDVPALANALGCLIRSRELRERMGVASRKRFEAEFTTASVFNAFMRCYGALDIPLKLEVEARIVGNRSCNSVL